MVDQAAIDLLLAGEPVVSRWHALGSLTPRRLHQLPLEQVRPLVRIAHRLICGSIIPRIILDHELILFLAGRGQILYGQERQKFAAGDLVLIRPFLLHQIAVEPAEPVDHVAVHFDLAVGVPGAERDLLQRKPYEVQLTGSGQLPAGVKLPPDSQIERDMLAIVAAKAAATPLGELDAAARLMRIIVALLELKQRRRPLPAALPGPRGRIERTMLWMQQHLAQRITLQELLRVSGLSRSHFLRLFRRATGYSPMLYLRRIRVDRAMELLAGSDLSIKEVAFRAGFADPYHFSRVFHQLDGLSPSDYRAAVLAETDGPSRSAPGSPDPVSTAAKKLSAPPRR